MGWVFFSKMSKCQNVNLSEMMYGKIQTAVGEGCTFLEFHFVLLEKYKDTVLGSFFRETHMPSIVNSGYQNLISRVLGQISVSIS